MNPWILTATIAAGSLIPCAFACLRGSPERRLVGLEMTGIVVIILFVLLTIGYGRLPFIDMPLTLAMLSFGAGLVFARFLERQL